MVSAEGQPVPISSLNHAQCCIEVHLFTLITDIQLHGLKGREKKYSHAVTFKILLRTEQGQLHALS